VRGDPAVWLIAVGQTLAWAALYYLFPALLLRWEDEMGWSKPALTLAITMAVLVSAAVSPLAGRLVDRGYGASMMGLSAACGGLGLIGLSFAQDVAQFQAAWLVIGLAMGGCLYEPSFAIVTRARGARAKQAIILITLTAGFASTISFPANFALAEALGWRDGVRLVGGLVIVVVAPMLWLGAKLLEQARDPDVEAPSVESAGHGYLRQPGFWFLAIAFACLALVHSTTVQHLLPILDERGMSPELAVLAAAAIGPMQVAGRLVLVALQHKLSNHWATVIAYGALAFSLVVLLSGSSSGAGIGAFVIVFGAAVGAVSILRPVIVREILGGDGFGTKNGALALPYLAGAALAPYLGALIWGWVGYDILSGILVAVCAVGAGLYMGARRFCRL